MKIEIGGDGSGCLFVGQVFNMTTDQLIIGVSGSWGVGGQTDRQTDRQADRQAKFKYRYDFTERKILH